MRCQCFYSVVIANSKLDYFDFLESHFCFLREPTETLRFQGIQINSEGPDPSNKWFVIYKDTWKCFHSRGFDNMLIDTHINIHVCLYHGFTPGLAYMNTYKFGWHETSKSCLSVLSLFAAYPRIYTPMVMTGTSWFGWSNLIHRDKCVFSQLNILYADCSTKIKIWKQES